MQKVLKTNLGREIVADLQCEELIYGVTAIAIGCKSKYYPACKEGVNQEEYVIHPLTNEKLDILALNDDKLNEQAIMLVPAHIQQHFQLAQKYNLRVKQVVAPYCLGEADEKIRPEVETKFRRSIVAVVKDNKTNKYLCVDSKGRDCKSFVMGGIEGDETPEQAMLREVEEETGYCDVKVLYTSLFVIHNHFYAAYKKVNRYAYLYVVFGELNSDKHHELSAEEFEKQSHLWLAKSELEGFLSVNNNKFIYSHFLDGDKAFEEDGMMINSAEFDGKLRSEVQKSYQK